MTMDTTNCTKTSGAIAGRPWTFSKVQKIKNLYKFGSLLVGFTKDIYQPMGRWSNVSVCTAEKGTTTYRYGVLNQDMTWSLLNKVDNHLFVFAYILNIFEGLNINVVNNDFVDVELLSTCLERGEYVDEDGVTTTTPKKVDLFAQRGMYYEDIICMIYGTTKKGDETETKAMEYLKSISSRSGEWEGMCPGDMSDVNKGIDILQVLGDGKTQGFQVKPFATLCFDHNNFTVGGVGNAKIYKQAPNGPDYYVFGGQGEFDGSFIIFKNSGVGTTLSKNEWGGQSKSYTFPKSSIIKHNVDGLSDMVCGNLNKFNESKILKGLLSETERSRMIMEEYQSNPYIGFVIDLVYGVNFRIDDLQIKTDGVVMKVNVTDPEGYYSNFDDGSVIYRNALPVNEMDETVRYFVGFEDEGNGEYEYYLTELIDSFTDSGVVGRLMFSNGFNFGNLTVIADFTR